MLVAPELAGMPGLISASWPEPSPSNLPRFLATDDRS